MGRASRLTVLGSLLLATQAPAEIIERVVAVVNGDIITQSEFESRQVAAVQAARISQDAMVRFLQQNNARLMQEAVDDVLLYQKGREEGLQIPPEYLDQVIQGIKEQNGLKNDTEMRAQLRREGMTIDDLKRQVERQIVRREVLAKEVGTGVTITEAEARDDYEARLETDYKRPATVHLQSILISNEREDAEELAKQIVERARGGEEFQTLAKTYSDSPTGEAGGDLGDLVLDEISADIRNVAEALEPGQVADPRMTAAGYQVLHLVGRTPESVIPFEEIKADLTKRIAQQRNAARYEKYMEDLRQSASIQLMVREVGLEVDVPVEPSLLDDANAGGAPEPVDPNAEFSVSGASGPRRVVPPDSPTTEPQPTPTPQGR